MNAALESDFFVLPPSSVVVDRGSYFAVFCKERPDFVFGNYLALKSPPAPSKLKEWAEIWIREFEASECSRTIAFQWEDYSDNAKCPEDFSKVALTCKFAQERSVIMQLASPPAAVSPSVWVSRPVTTEHDWSEAEELLESELEDSRPGDSFTRWRFAQFRALVGLGKGEWWGLWADAQLIGTAGIFWTEENRIGRLQNVVTRTGFRNRGVCTRLCQEIVHARVYRLNLTQLIVVAAEGSQASGIYCRLGFRPIGVQTSLSKSVTEQV